MPTFRLETAFNEQDLQRFLASGSNVVVAKPAGGGVPNVAWVVYRPLLANTMTWQEDYGIYASNAAIVNSAQLTQMSQTPYPAHADATYSLNPAGFFGPPTSGGVPSSYTAENAYDNLPKGYLTMGLYQDATVNGAPVQGNAVSAAAVIYQSTAVMTPFTTVYLWIQSSVVSNTVVTTVTSPMTKVTFGGPVTDVKLRYDASSGIFLPVGGDEVLGEGIGVDHLVPALV